MNSWWLARAGRNLRRVMDILWLPLAVLTVVAVIVSVLWWTTETDNEKIEKENEREWDELVSFCADELNATARSVGGDWLCVKDSEIVYDY